ncbi:uroporphyrinogen decarboxylase [Marinibaculum pumilum]|uniref:Uroporphyrinogen decarboxylase n=1 Tax=Marinibaculum pumilum TaxID=1766165 RepID=A0ABV7KUV6_9PROT
MTAANADKSLLAVARGRRRTPPPAWLMRQAGRYLPEYREVRARAGSFLDLCFQPEMAAEVTLQPIRRFGFDAAILFADILLLPHALGREVRFVEGEGPRLDPLQDAATIAGLQDIDPLPALAPVFETVSRVQQALPDDCTLIGFAGAPWTVATYMVAGGTEREQVQARLFAYREPAAFQSLIDRLTETTIAYLEAQIAAGAEAVKLFDSWSGALAPAEFRRWCQLPAARIVATLHARHPDVPVIGFPRGCGGLLTEYAASTGVDVIALDTGTDPAWADRVLPPGLPVQGNLDPLALIAGGGALEQAVAGILAALGNRPHVFNLGHGILPQTPPDNVAALLRLLRGD